jgi:hypothetical protein
VTVVGPDGDKVASGVLRSSGAPDLGAVDGIARLALAAGRLGGAMFLAQVSPALDALLELTGLRVQMEGESESREEPLGVQRGQEERHSGDLPP